MKSRCVAAALIASTVLWIAPASAQTKWNLPAAYPADNPHSENLVAFVKDFDTATGDKLQITVHPDASMPKSPDIKHSVSTAQTQIGEVPQSRNGPPEPVFTTTVAPLF